VGRRVVLGVLRPRREEALERMRRVVLQYAMVPTHRASFRGSFPALDEAAAAWPRGW
jgi:hypothetical protein